MKVIESNIIYENPKPALRARGAAFPNLCQLANGRILADQQIGEAFESVDGASYICESTDGGTTWSEPWKMFDNSRDAVAVSESSKVTLLPDGRLVALGYQFFRHDPELALGNPETGGLLDDEIFFSVSEDDGRTWSDRVSVNCAWGNHVEASAPVSVLQDGSWATPITGFAKWDGTMSARNCGRLLRSYDEGKTWNDDTVCMAFPGDTVTCFEQRMCQLEDGTLVVIGWNEDMVSGERLPNHITFSYDNGKTFTDPVSTGIGGQATSITALEGNKVLTLHAIRRDTDRPGVYACVADVSGGKWELLEQEILWEPETPLVGDKKAIAIFAFVKFGQPSAIRLQDGDFLMTHWYCQEGQYKTCATRFRL